MPLDIEEREAKTEGQEGAYIIDTSSSVGLAAGPCKFVFSEWF